MTSRIGLVVCPSCQSSDARAREPPRRRRRHRCAGGASATAAASGSPPSSGASRDPALRDASATASASVSTGRSFAPRSDPRRPQAAGLRRRPGGFVDRIEIGRPATRAGELAAERIGELCLDGPPRARPRGLSAVRRHAWPSRPIRNFRGHRSAPVPSGQAREDSEFPPNAAGEERLDELKPLQTTLSTAKAGTDGRAPLHHPRRPPLRRDRVGAPRRGHRRPGEPRVRAARGRVPDRLVTERDQHRRPEVLPRQARLAGARALREADDLPGRRDDRRLGARGRLLRHRRGRRRLRGRADPHPAPPEGGLQQPGVVQRRLRGAAAVLRLLHPLGRRTRWSRSSTGTPRRG